MTRIPDDELRRIKGQVKVEDLCRAYGIELKRMGPDTLMGKCPFHEDHDPSFGVTPSKNLWNCLAGCGGGDVIQLVMKKEGVSFRHAVEILRGRLGVSAEEAPTMTTRTGTTHPVLVDPEAFDSGAAGSGAIASDAGDCEAGGTEAGGIGADGSGTAETDMADHELLRRVMEFYHQTFCNEPKAMKYLQQRRCFDAEAAKVFQIGFANRTLGYRVPMTTASGKRLKEQLQRLGIFRDSGHEHLTGSVVFPILDEHGNVAQMYGRKITAGLREGTPLHLYLAGGHRAVWNATGLRAGGGQKEWLLCESIIDALTLWCAGFRNVTCSYGVNGFTEAHWALIDEIKPIRIVICYDNDPAGNAAAMKLAEQLRARGIIVTRAKLPEGKDINDVARENADARVALAIALETPATVAGMDGPALPPETTTAAAKEETEQQPPPQSTPPPESPSSAPLPVLPLAAAPGKPTTAAAKEETRQPTAPVPPVLPLAAASSDPQSVQPPSPPAPRAKAGSADVDEVADEAYFSFGPRQWRVRGLAKNLSYETLRVQLRVLVQGHDQYQYHLDTLDLCNAKHRQNFLMQAQNDTGLDIDLLRRDLGQVFLKVEEAQEKLIKAALEPREKEVAITDPQRESALALLRDPKLLDRILADFEHCGVVGEQTNKLVGYLAAISRKLDDPLAVIIQSTSAAGKSSLMEAILAFVPEEHRVKYSAMTGQSLYYLGDSDLRHKVLAIVEEEGATRASYALKLLQSEGELTIASTGKDPQTGRMITQEYHVEGPVMIMLTTTAIDIDEELLNRCIVLSVDESREQTRAIHALQRRRETLDGMLLRLDRQGTLDLHRNAQRLLRPLKVVNPYAGQLTFLDDRTRTRRDHMKYLGMIRTLALLHQYQRPLKTSGHVAYVEVTLEDIATANRLAGDVLGRSLDDLPPQTRRLLSLIHEWVEKECKRLCQKRPDFRFSRRDVRQVTGWGNTQLKLHLARLEEMEYLLVHRGRRGQSFVYELLYEGQGGDGKPFMVGLIDAEKLHKEPLAAPSDDDKKSGAKVRKSAPGRGVAGTESATGRADENSASPNENGPVERDWPDEPPNERLGTQSPGPS